MPALLKAMSSRPKVSTVRSTSGGDLVLVGDVAGDAEHLVAGGGQLVGGGVERVLVDVGEDHRGPASAKACAVASPMPEPAPVTRATWPVKS